MPKTATRESRGLISVRSSHLFRTQLWKIKKYPGEISTRAREALDIPHGNGIALQISSNNRNACSRTPGRCTPLWSVCVDDVHFASNNVTRSLLHQLWFEVGKAVFDRDVFALLKARFSKTPPEGGN